MNFQITKKKLHHIDSPEKINQRIRFNLIRHKGTVSDIPVSKLFKSFASTLKKTDPLIVFHPFQADKQHYSSLVTAKQIHSIDDNKIPQFFKVLSSETVVLPQWVFSNIIRSFPRGLIPTPYYWQMAWILSLLYKNLPQSRGRNGQNWFPLLWEHLHFHDHLKQAIMMHPLWTSADPSNPPFFMCSSVIWQPLVKKWKCLAEKSNSTKFPV